MIVLPGTGDRVVLRPDVDSRHPVVVESLDGNTVLITAPSLPGDLIRDRLGDAMELEWATPRGLVVAEVRLTGAVRDRVRLWSLEMLGQPDVLQRRRYARAEINEPGVLLVRGQLPDDDHPDAGAPEEEAEVVAAPRHGMHVVADLPDEAHGWPEPWTVGMTVVEVSEASLVVHVPDGGVTEGDLVEAHLVVDGEQVALPGVAGRVSTLVPPGHGAQRVLLLVESGPAEATLLRRTVLRAQLEQRRRTSA